MGFEGGTRLKEGGSTHVTCSGSCWAEPAGAGEAGGVAGLGCDVSKGDTGWVEGSGAFFSHAAHKAKHTLAKPKTNL
jgi:hypothetical protein